MRHVMLSDQITVGQNCACMQENQHGMMWKQNVLLSMQYAHEHDAAHIFFHARCVGFFGAMGRAVHFKMQRDLLYPGLCSLTLAMAMRKTPCLL